MSGPWFDDNVLARAIAREARVRGIVDGSLTSLHLCVLLATLRSQSCDAPHATTAADRLKTCIRIGFRRPRVEESTSRVRAEAVSTVHAWFVSPVDGTVIDVEGMAYHPTAWAKKSYELISQETLDAAASSRNNKAEEGTGGGGRKSRRQGGGKPSSAAQLRQRLQVKSLRRHLSIAVGSMDEYWRSCAPPEVRDIASELSSLKPDAGHGLVK